MATSNGLEKLHNIIEKVFKISAGEIDDSLSSQTVPTWDSFNYLMLISELEKEFNISFSMDEVLNFKNLGEIKNVIRNNGIIL